MHGGGSKEVALTNLDISSYVKESQGDVVSDGLLDRWIKVMGLELEGGKIAD